MVVEADFFFRLKIVPAAVDRDDKVKTRINPKPVPATARDVVVLLSMFDVLLVVAVKPSW